MLTSQAERDEAVRLIQLDPDGLAVESVALALRIGEGYANAAQALQELDIKTVELMFDGRASVRDRQADIGDAE